MSSPVFHVKYENLYNSLSDIIEESERRVLDDEPDALMIDNVNFFVKSYLICICTYLESFLQDLAFDYASDINSRLKKAALPHNYFLWRMNKDFKTKDLNFSNVDLTIAKEDISKSLSANPHKTIALFKFLGVDLVSESEFRNNIGLVDVVVSKRNSIIHHNDRAADVSFSDLKSYIAIFIPYMKGVERAVSLKREDAHREHNSQLLN